MASSVSSKPPQKQTGKSNDGFIIALIGLAPLIIFPLFFRFPSWGFSGSAISPSAAPPKTSSVVVNNDNDDNSGINGTAAIVNHHHHHYYPCTSYGAHDSGSGSKSYSDSDSDSRSEIDIDIAGLTITSGMSWFQKQFTLKPASKGAYLITDQVTAQVPEIKDYKVGLLHLFVQHTSCGLSLNENWDEEVREDMSDALDRLAPEDRKGNLYRHSAEGIDDMPAHIKSALVGASVTVPITNGKLNTGTWQGIWYLEFRASRHTRKVVATIQGERM